MPSDILLQLSERLNLQRKCVILIESSRMATKQSLWQNLKIFNVLMNSSFKMKGK